MLALCIGLFSCDDGKSGSDDESSNDDDDDNNDNDAVDDDDDDTQPDCSNNHPPEIHTPILGILMPDTYTYLPGIMIKGEDELIITNRYRDEDCNLAGGKVRSRTSETSFTSDEIPENDKITCGWDFGGNYMVVRLGSSFVLENFSTEKDYWAEVYYVDACGGESEILQFPFNVYELPEGQGQELVSNGSFEEGDSGWEAHSLLGYPVINRDILNTMPINPRTGQYASWLGGYSKGRDLLLQQVEFPEQMQSGFFEVWVYAATWDFDQEKGDLLEFSLVDQLGQKTLLRSLYDRESFHQYAALRAIVDEETATDLSGGTYWLTIEYIDDQDDHSTWFIVDDISLRVWTDVTAKKGSKAEVETKVATKAAGRNPNQKSNVDDFIIIPDSNRRLGQNFSPKKGKKEKDCDDNLPPSFSFTKFENDGAPLHEPFFTFMDEKTEVFFHWSDPECDMGGGAVYFSIWPYLWESAYLFPEWEDHGCFGNFSIKYNSWIQRENEMYFLIEDGCGAYGNYISFKLCDVLMPDDDSRPDALTNGDFENGSDGWVITGSGLVDFSTSSSKARIGSGTVIIEGYTGDTVAISQSVELPGEKKMAMLAFWLKIIAGGTSGSTVDTLSVRFEGEPSPMAEFSNKLADDFASDWRYYYYDISDRIGYTKDLVFEFDFDLDRMTEYRLDAVTVRYD